MAYSFIRPKPKSIFKRVTKIWTGYIILAVLFIFAYEKILEIQIINRINEQTSIEENVESIKLKVIVVKDYIERLDYEIKLGETIQTQNEMLKDAVANLFKLIPHQITANSMELNYNRLVIKGLTPSKEVYKFLLEAPLRAIFTETRVEFYPLMSGWFNFVSVSKANPILKPINTQDKDKDNE